MTRCFPHDLRKLRFRLAHSELVVTRYDHNDVTRYSRLYIYY